MIALEAAGGDPLRAQEIYNGVNEEWWTYYTEWRRAQSEADEAKKMSNG